MGDLRDPLDVLFDRTTGDVALGEVGGIKLFRDIAAITDKPVWVSEIGVSSFGAEEVQEWGLRTSIALIAGTVPRIHWYSLFDLPRTWEATTRHKEAEGSSYYRHFHMGLIREDGSPNPAFARIANAPC